MESILGDAKSKLTITEPAILKIRAIFEKYGIPGKGYVEESLFQSGA
ncbi:MAG: hypothetical protein QXL27_02005 [Candidatus Bathyarchaeia archaeon]